MAEELAVTKSQAYALVRAGTLAGIQVGGRGRWRIERSELERYIADAYAHAHASRHEQPSAANEPTGA